MAKNRKFQIPAKEAISGAIERILRVNKRSRSELLREAALALGVSREEEADKNPQSKNTAYKSIIGTVLDELVGQGKLTYLGKLYMITAPSTQQRAPVRQQKKDDSFESITSKATELFRQLLDRTEELREKYLNELSRCILKCLAVCSSEFFEEVCVKLVCRVYGVSEDFGQVTGGTDDEGIDGIVNLVDEFGFNKETIFIQCKCRKNIDNYTTATEVREFRGAVAKKKGKRSLFMTNGIMHKDALKETVDNDPLLLVDGTKLAELMIKYQLGVRTRGSLPVIDDEFYPIVK